MKISRLTKTSLVAAALAVSLGAAVAPLPALADDDHERARRALQAGELLSLNEILKRVQQTQPGEVLEVELERERDRWVYELKVLSRDGALIKLDVDGRDGSVLRTRRR